MTSLITTLFVVMSWLRTVTWPTPEDTNRRFGAPNPLAIDTVPLPERPAQ